MPDKNNHTLNTEDVKRLSAKEGKSEKVNQYLDYFNSDNCKEDFIRFRKEYIRINKENEKLKEKIIRLEADIAFWKPLALGLLSVLFVIIGAVLGIVVMKKCGFL